MDKKIIKFSGNKIKKHKFHQHKSPVLIVSIDINKIVISNQVTCNKKGFKSFVGYKDCKKIDVYVYCS